MQGIRSNSIFSCDSFSTGFPWLLLLLLLLAMAFYAGTKYCKYEKKDKK